MNPKTRLQLIDQIAQAMENDQGFESYSAKIDKLLEAGMSLDEIDVEVEARRLVLREKRDAEARLEQIQSTLKSNEENIDRQIGKLRRNGVFAAVGILLLAVIASAVLMRFAFDREAPTPVAAPPGTWQIKVIQQPAVPAENGRQQVIVDALVTDVDGQPAPDGVPVYFDVEDVRGKLSPNPALVRGGFARTLLNAPSGVSELAISVSVHEDTQPVAIALALPTPSATPTATPPREPTAPPTETPTPTPIVTPTAPTPTPEPLQASIEIKPTWDATDTLDIGFGQTGDITLTLTQGGQPVPNAQVIVRPQPTELMQIVSPSQEGVLITDASGIICTTVKATGVGEGKIYFEITGAKIDPVPFALKPMISVPANSNLRSGPSQSGDVIRTTQSAERFVVTGKALEGKTTWWQLRLPGPSAGVAYVGSGVNGLKFDPPDGDKRVSEIAATPTAPIVSSASSGTPSQTLEAGSYKLKPVTNANAGGIELFSLGDNGPIVIMPLEVSDQRFELTTQVPGKPEFVQGQLSLWVKREFIKSEGEKKLISPTTDGPKMCWKPEDTDSTASCGRLLREVEVVVEEEKDDWVRITLTVWIKTANIGDKES